MVWNLEYNNIILLAKLQRKTKEYADYTLFLCSDHVDNSDTCFSLRDTLITKKYCIDSINIEKDYTSYLDQTKNICCHTCYIKLDEIDPNKSNMHQMANLRISKYFEDIEHMGEYIQIRAKDFSISSLQGSAIFFEKFYNICRFKWYTNLPYFTKYESDRYLFFSQKIYARSNPPMLEYVECKDKSSIYPDMMKEVNFIDKEKARELLEKKLGFIRRNSFYGTNPNTKSLYPNYFSEIANKQFTNLRIAYMFSIADIKFSGYSVIVFWKDGTKTMVTMQDDEKEFDVEKAIFAAFTKKALSFNDHSKKRSMTNVLGKWLKKYEELKEDNEKHMQKLKERKENKKKLKKFTDNVLSGVNVEEALKDAYSDEE